MSSRITASINSISEQVTAVATRPGSEAAISASSVRSPSLDMLRSPAILLASKEPKRWAKKWMPADDEVVDDALAAIDEHKKAGKSEDEAFEATAREKRKKFPGVLGPHGSVQTRLNVNRVDDRSRPPSLSTALKNTVDRIRSLTPNVALV